MSKRENYCIGGRDHAPKPYHYMECGLPDIYLLNGFSVESHDGEDYVSVENVDGLWKAIGLNLVTRKKLLDPKEIRFLRNQMDMTQSELASLLRVDDQTVARWEKGHAKEMPGPADISLRSLFLSSEVAQPEGSQILGRWMKIVEELVERDSPVHDAFLFQNSGASWNLQNKIAA
jgi:DNA-binding transcriptional regulator YiaG